MVGSINTDRLATTLGSFTERALEAVGARDASGEPRFVRGSLHDFVHAVHVLGAGTNRGRIPLDVAARILRVHVGCPYDTWLKVFGEPENLEAMAADSGDLPLYVWRHACSDGPVTCIGHLYERTPGMKWVLAVRVSLW